MTVSITDEDQEAIRDALEVLRDFQRVIDAHMAARTNRISVIAASTIFHQFVTEANHSSLPPHIIKAAEELAKTILALGEPPGRKHDA